ncbi:MAG: TldD/PmbA family protein [Clostridiales bacterium]|nr:TldD/PmbA family protein [Clostridiales bacterium]
MPFSSYLDRQREHCAALVEALDKHFRYVSILGTDVHATMIRADRRSSAVQDGAGECGFVVKLHDGKAFYEYSLDDISGDKEALAEKILSAVKADPSLESRMISAAAVADEPMVKDFVRESDFADYTDEQLLGVCQELSTELIAKDEKVLNAIAVVQPYVVSKLFVTKNRQLSQHYSWANGFLLVVYAGEKMVQARHGEGSDKLSEIIANMKGSTDKVIELARNLAKATPIEPGVYDVITDSSISGLIAHEAFGHGVEMDQFVKDRALAKNCMGEYVASPITNMRDGAAATHSVASYFFDDDGVLAHDTQIIRDGVLVAGLSDLASATQLGTEPTGNGRRDSYKRKAYSRMTNTFFEPGKDKLEDMIASIKHGYMLFETNNGMEDPKNWQIQCTAEYGIEIVDGKLTDHYVSPVVMSGSVPELLKSISMVSDQFKVIGAGMCGKGYKEWVRVSDGGPNLKVRVKLG